MTVCFHRLRFVPCSTESLESLLESMVDLTLVFTRLVILKNRSAVAVAEARNYSKLLPFYVFIYIKLFVSNIQVST